MTGPHSDTSVPNSAASLIHTYYCRQKCQETQMEAKFHGKKGSIWHVYQKVILTGKEKRREDLSKELRVCQSKKRNHEEDWGQ